MDWSAEMPLQSESFSEPSFASTKLWEVFFDRKILVGRNQRNALDQRSCADAAVGGITRMGEGSFDRAQVRITDAKPAKRSHFGNDTAPGISPRSI